MRILIGPLEIAGIAGGLKAGFDRIGVEAELVFSQPHPFRYGASASRSVIPRIWSRLGEACFGGRNGGPWRALLLLVWKAWSVCVLAWALWRFDGFIFLYGNTLTNSRLEAWCLAKLHKRVVVIYCGSDSRPPYIDGQAFWDASIDRPEAVAALAARVSSKIALYERHGFICVNSPFTAQFHGSPYVSWFAMGVARSFVRAPEPEPGAGPLRILHSPSNPPVKGTPHIVALVEELKRRGHALELVLLHKVPHDLVLGEIARADIVVDQLYSDTPMAVFALEAARCGKPVLVAGYAAWDDLAEVVRAPAPPSLFVRPEALGEALERLITDPGLRTRLGCEARAFVDSDWAPEAVATRYLRLLRDGPPDEWTIAPDAVVYLHGGGLAEDNARRAVAELVGACGPAALHLDHKPELRDAFLAFARGAEPPA